MFLHHKRMCIFTEAVLSHNIKAVLQNSKLNKCLFSYQFSSFGVEMCHESTVLGTLYCKNAKRQDFFPEMSCILDTRIPPFCNSGNISFKMKRKC